MCYCLIGVDVVEWLCSGFIVNGDHLCWPKHDGFRAVERFCIYRKWLPSLFCLLFEKRMWFQTILKPQDLNVSRVPSSLTCIGFVSEERCYTACQVSCVTDGICQDQIFDVCAHSDLAAVS